MLGGAETAGVIARLEGNVALVEVQPQSGCGRCAEPGGCGRQTGGAARAYRIPNRIGARVGDEVLISIGEGSVLRAALLSYGFCSLLIIAFAAIGRAWQGSDAGAIVGGVLGILSGLCCMRLLQRKLGVQNGMQPTIKFSSRLVHREEEK